MSFWALMGLFIWGFLMGVWWANNRHIRWLEERARDLRTK